MTINLKYVPVLRYRSSEKNTLNSVAISNKILPLIEIVTVKPKVNSKKTCIEEIKEFTENHNTKVIVDFPLYIKLFSNSIPGVASFIRTIQGNPNLRLAYYSQLIGTNIIPVVTYNPNIPLITGSITNETNTLRKTFEQLAFRIFVKNGLSALTEIAKIINSNDILILDLDIAQHSHSGFNGLFNQVTKIAKKANATSVLMRSAINTDITNTGLTNNQVVQSADNSLLIDYKKYGFDSFGDFCGVKKDDLTEGGRPSPGCLFYHWPTNSFYGHKGLFLQLNTFTTMVVPSLTNSTEWNYYSTTHKKGCSGCKTVENIVNGNESANSAPKWKVIASSHYLYTMEEFL